MDDIELERLLDDIESDRAERTESVNDGDKWRKAVCAFANDLPDHRRAGVLFVGVGNDGRPTGVEITDTLLLNLSHMRNDGNILPFPSLDVEKRKLKGKDVAVVFVHPSHSPPVRFKGLVEIRSGPRRGIANPDDERRLNEKRRFRDIPFDIRPLVSAGVDVLDELVFRREYLPHAVALEVVEQNQRTLEQQLSAARFVHPGPPACATLLGALTVGKTPTDWAPCAYVQFLRVDGAALGDPVIDAREIRGPLPELLRNLEDVIKNNIRSSVDYTTQALEVRVPDYPIVALQQIVRNAILHRSYENTHDPVRLYWFANRVEAQSPGGPFGRVTKENFSGPGAYDYRNPNLAAVLKELGYVQRFGSGIALARRAMAENGNPPPEFLVEDGHVAVILRRRT
ncbi:MAG: putative DNA binding domain-containing protein [Planctomycetes bacterium]|nr:putative DNA binding domain-containing protein [Planctomycetota bacterium]